MTLLTDATVELVDDVNAPLPCDAKPPQIKPGFHHLVGTGPARWAVILKDCCGRQFLLCDGCLTFLRSPLNRIVSACHCGGGHPDHVHDPAMLGVQRVESL